MPRENLNQNRLEIWHTSCTDIADHILNHAEIEILSGEERDYLYRFRQSSDRRLYLGSRLLLRSMLHAFTGVAAGDWRFRFNEYGKPEPEEGFPQVHFNLSHSKGLAVCAMHPGRDVGVDVEAMDGQIDSCTASSVLIGREWQSYLEAPEEKKSEVFTKYWVLKEAYLKALGRGLSLPPTGFSFVFDEAGAPELRSTNTEGDHVDDWLFFEFQPTSMYAAAAAIRRDADQPVELCIKPFSPWNDCGKHGPV